MSNLGKIIYLTESQLATLILDGSITVDDKTIVYSENDIYMTPSQPSIPSGGTAGQILIKNSSTDLDAAWSSPIVPIALSLNTTNVSTFLGMAVKLFNLVIISGRFNLKSFSSGGWKNLATIPTEFRPTGEKGFMAGHGGTVAVRDGVVGSSGALNVYCETSDSYIYCTIIYDL